MDPKVNGIATANPAGGHDINVQAFKMYGHEKTNATVGVFAAGNTLNKTPATTGAFAGINANGHGLGIQHSKTHGVGSSLSESARLNILQKGPHSVDLNAMHSHTRLNDGLKFDKIGGNMAWQHERGHGASVGVSQIPKFNMTTVDAAAKVNLWTSTNKSNTLDLTGNASRHLSGPFAGRNDFGGSLGISHRF